MKAKEIMTHDPVVVTPDEPISRAAEVMEQYDVGFVPVVADRETMRLTGLITDRDVAVRHVAADCRNGCTVGEHMTAKGLEVVHPDTDVRDVLGRMARDQIRRVPVVDEQHRLLGVIAQADLAVKYALHQPEREIAVEETIERISEPAQPRR